VARPHLPLLFKTHSNRRNKQLVRQGKSTSVEQSRLVGHGSTWAILKDVYESDVMVSADAKSDAEVGIALRFHDSGNSIVAVYSPPDSKASGSMKDRTESTVQGWAFMDVPEISADYRLVAEAHGSAASLHH